MIVSLMLNAGRCCRTGVVAAAKGHANLATFCRSGTGPTITMRRTAELVGRSITKRWSMNAPPQTELVQWQRNRIIGWWLLSCAGLTYVTVWIGGLTRLTESGLSMVDWHPFKEMPPRHSDEWQREFEKYQQFPEWKIKNRDITLEEFKRIWYMEYAHRMLGRTIGAVYFIPAAIFWFVTDLVWYILQRLFFRYRKWLNRSTKIRVGIFGSLLAGQGLLGWYMVKSGLEEKPMYEHEPRVSQYRLAAHLGTAMAFYSLIFYNGLINVTGPVPGTVGPNGSIPPVTRNLIRFKRLVGMSKLFIFTTALSGAFVAGMDAGLVYNTWPKMADRWLPTDLTRLQPLWRNLFENATCAQFVHRHLGELTGLFVAGLWAYSLRLPLTRRARFATHFVAATIFAQIMLGITALVHHVPVPVASAHQANALLALSAALWLSKELRWIKKMPK